MRGAIISWNGTAGAVGRHQHGLIVDGDDPLTPADLLLDQIGQQVAAHGAGRICAEPLALARDRRGHEVERIQLGVGVGQRRARLAPLIDDQVHIGRLPVGPHALAPHLHRLLHLLGLELGQRNHGLGRVDDHLVGPVRRPRPEQVGVGLGLGMR